MTNAALHPSRRHEEGVRVCEPDAVIDGLSVHSCADPSVKGAFNVRVHTGPVPRRIVNADPESGGTIDFYDDGAKITIDLAAVQVAAIFAVGGARC